MKKRIKISGMHCISCEMILEKAIENMSGVDMIMVNHKKGILEVNYEKEADYKELVKIIEQNNFTVGEENKKEKKVEGLDSQSNMLLNVIAIMFVVILLIATQLFDLYSLIPDTSSLSYSSAFLIGIIASLSTCLAITGGIVIGFSRYLDKQQSTLGHLKVQGGFQIGRILGFFVLGGLLGLVGEVFNLSIGLTGLITFLVGFILLYMGLNILGIIPSITKYGVHMPKSFASKIENLGKPKYAPIVGALTFFLPCGFTQTIQLLAISSGSFWVGGLVMMFFALGTAPVLFSVGLGSSYFKEKKFPVFTKIIGAIVIFFGVFTVANSYNLLKFTTPLTSPDNIENVEQEVVNKGELEEIAVSHNGWQTIPSIIELKAGGNYKLVITPTKNGLGCMSTQAIPGLSKQVSYVKKGVPIVYEIYNAKPGKYNIVCTSMGMTQGQVIVK